MTGFALLSVLVLLAGEHTGATSVGGRRRVRASREAGAAQSEGDVLAEALEVLRAAEPGRRKHSREQGRQGDTSSAPVATSAAGLEAPEEKKPLCTAAHFSQAEQLRGEWRPHKDPGYRGLYKLEERCPAQTREYSCAAQAQGDQPLEDQLRTEYSQVYHPEACQLRPWEASGFSDCLKDRRLIIIGDSLMRQQFNSLGCLLAPEILDVKAQDWWDAEDYPVQGEYEVPWRDGVNITARKQFLGDITTKSGLKVSLRSYGTLQEQLWDDVMEEFMPLQPSDVLLVNFGAWYPRYKWHEKDAPWANWQRDMGWLIRQRLATYPCKVLWKEYAPTHFGGFTGTFTGIEESLPNLPAKPKCYDATVGEYWYDEWVREELQSCGSSCDHIHILPIFQLSLARPDSHQGSFERGREEGVLDCRHFCENVVDLWNVVMYNKLCF